MFLGILLGMVLFSALFFSRFTSPESKKEIKINNQIIIADVAVTPEARSRGLGGRDYLGFNEGMLFVFDDFDKYGFWMRDMKIPIDIVWIRGNDIVGVEENVQPPPDPKNPDKIYEPPLPVNKILEVVAGRAKVLNAKAGDRVFMRPLIGQVKYE